MTRVKKCRNKQFYFSKIAKKYELKLFNIQ